jgi:hypothetical protein
LLRRESELCASWTEHSLLQNNAVHSVALALAQNIQIRD